MDLLSDIIGSYLEDVEKVLDVGCGDGKIDNLIMQKKTVDISGVDVLVREDTYIKVREFDGEHLPFEDNSFDAVLFVDVIHHIDNPGIILSEAKRVAKRKIIIKDHLSKSKLDDITLKFMDYVGNAHYGVRLPYNYMSKKQWEELFSMFNLNTENWNERLSLYPFPFTLFFDRKLHFIAKLIVPEG